MGLLPFKLDSERSMYCMYKTRICDHMHKLNFRVCKIFAESLLADTSRFFASSCICFVRKRPNLRLRLSHRHALWNKYQLSIQKKKHLHVWDGAKIRANNVQWARYPPLFYFYIKPLTIFRKQHIVIRRCAPCAQGNSRTGTAYHRAYVLQ